MKPYIPLSGILFLLLMMTPACDQLSENNGHSSSNNPPPANQNAGTQPSGNTASNNKNIETIYVGEHQIRVEIARTNQQRKEGLKKRDTLPEDQGMLFIFDQPARLSFWMKETYIPLDLAYINENFRIVGIHPMIPRDTTPVYSSKEAQYALEMNRGWFREHNVEKGDRVDIPDRILSK